MEQGYWEDKAKQAVEKQNRGEGAFLYSLLDFTFTYDEQEEALYIDIPISEPMLNSGGSIHGGMYAYIGDTAMGYLCMNYGAGPSVTLELKTQFFHAVSEGNIRAKAYFLKKGRTVQFTEATIHSEEGTLLAKLTGTFYKIKK
ncbi:PaaI family thioesterase [Texcoconibacillus texcoconensis]|uniref:Uncharacterized protein (TIGR00369 family) n=1 Tax=Texcoconibacillus texcoconensis TaxID=1095777 RepID=A0A840QPJ8_9BACI|nr:PaaI family thioesterase [Texcoconibacillus texcoconensis]MBB5173253.1 uncharacterized protein (TIGR00369 family) [Texcoconibacillus texcoconensis]